jgi:hypothetical protein
MVCTTSGMYPNKRGGQKYPSPSKVTFLKCPTLRVGQNHTFIGIYGVYTVFLAGKSPYIRSYTVCIYGSGQPYKLCLKLSCRTITFSLLKARRSCKSWPQPLTRCVSIGMVSCPSEWRVESNWHNHVARHCVRKAS